MTERLRFRGTVQGVGFRPAVARLARAHGLPGRVRNDGEGVLVLLGGDAPARDRFLSDLLAGLPPLARVDAVERTPSDEPPGGGFVIEPSAAGAVRTAVAPDAAPCAECLAEVGDPASRRFRYPFTTCAHCGPRYTIARALPWDRAATTLAGFPLCPDCLREYGDERDRRYHAQPLACPRCGPVARLVPAAGGPAAEGDAVDAAASRLRAGEIVAVKGLGGYQLCCDATDEAAVARLRARKRRPDRPFALLARDVAEIRRYCAVSDAEAEALRSAANPIVLLDASGPERVAPNVAPGARTLGFLLPATALHALLAAGAARPLVCTSGNAADEPPCTDDADAFARLGGVADSLLVHDRPIANRADDSVVRRLDGELRVLRRARGYAPAPIALHPSFAAAPPITALGGHLKATFCLLREGRAVLSPHLGDLDEPAAAAGFADQLRAYAALLDHAPARLAADLHPESRPAGLAPAGLPTERVGHHHAHAAAVMAEHGLPADTEPVLALVLDGLGRGEDGGWWGGELLACDFRRAERLAALPAVAMPGGDRAARQPWRSAVAHLVDALGWGAVEAVPSLRGRRSPLLELALRRAPRASSAGRLFDAVAAVLGLHAEATTFEAQAALALEAIAAIADGEVAAGYPVTMGDLGPMWRALLADLGAGVPAPVVAGRFHEGLARGLADAALAARPGAPVVLAGGVWQNAVLVRRAARHLRDGGRTVLLARAVPPNDGGLSLGQAAIAAARALGPPATE